MAHRDNDDELLEQLTLLLSSGKVDAGLVLPVLKQLTRSVPRQASVGDLLKSVGEHEGAVFARLHSHLQLRRLREARDFYQQRTSATTDQFELMLGDLPLQNARQGWKPNKQHHQSLLAVASLARDRRFIQSEGDVAPITAAHIEEQYSKARDVRQSLPATWKPLVSHHLIQCLSDRSRQSNPDLAKALQDLGRSFPESGDAVSSEESDADVSLSELVAQYKTAQTKADRQRLLDQLCCSRDVTAAQRILDLVQEPWEEERAGLILTCRFGTPAVAGWAGWSNWLARCERQWQQEVVHLHGFLDRNCGELFLLWFAGQPETDPEIIQQVEQWQATQSKRLNTEKFVERWAAVIPNDEWNALTGVEFDVVDTFGEVSDGRSTAKQLTSAAPAGQTAPPLNTQYRPQDVHPSRPPGPSLWNDHIQPFISEQWYMVAGLVMVLAGSSLLAYYTWDKHWLVRYTMMPLLLAAFTGGLAWMATWIERKDVQFVGTAAILRGAAIGLLPINFMAVALLSNDDHVSGKSVVVPLMGAIYLAVFGYGLKNWCRAVHKPLDWLLGGTLLLLNSLVMLGPLAKSVAHFTDSAVLIVIGVGFHLGFLVMAAAVVRFSRRVMTRELATQQRIPWFFGATLVVTFLQVFAWVHGYLRHLPHVSTYAPMIILTGGLVLLVERRALQLKDEEDRHGAESFVGFALILLGVLMGATQPHLRIASLLLAGAVWLYQTVARKEPLHDWIALTLLMLGAASVGMLDTFPKPLLPALGIGISVAIGVVGMAARRCGQQQLGVSCVGMHVSVLMLTTIVAVLAQWRYQTPPLYTGGCLLVIVGMFSLQAWRQDKLRWVQSAMAVLALSLLYLGCVDMNGRTLHGNTMVFGLAVISFGWLILNWCTSHRLVRESRSSVLWIYGALAVAGMVLRVFVERGTAGDAEWYRQWMDYTGPLLMTVVLVFTTWYSRSLIPAIMAAVIVIILFPELKANFRQTFTTMGWGSGLGSSLSAMGLILLCFPLQKAPFLKNLSAGDRFLGATPFPLRRYDHSLFTLPILASILFLTIKTDTWTIVRNWFGGSGLGVKTGIAVAVTGVTWTLLAVYNRRHPLAKFGTFLGSLWLLVGLWIAHQQLAESPHWTWPVLTAGIVLQIAYWVYLRSWRSPDDWVEHILVKPTRQVLEFSSIVVATICVLCMVFGRPLNPLLWLMALVSAQLVWHALTTKNLIHGSVLFALIWVGLLTHFAPGRGHLVDRLSLQHSLMPTLLMLLGIHFAFLLLEFDKAVAPRLRSLTLPFQTAASFISMTLVLLAIFDAFHDFHCTSNQLLLVLIVGLLTARAHTSCVLLLPVLMLACIFWHHDALLEFSGGSVDVAWRRLKYVCEPVRLSLFALTLVLVGHLGRQIYRTQRPVVSGSFGFSVLSSPHVEWMFIPAACFAILATTLHTALPSLRENPEQLWAPYVAAATFALFGRSRWQQWCLSIAVVLLTVGNIHCVRIFFGETLQQRGISELQMICLGTAATLLQGTLLRYAVRRNAVIVFVNQASLALAALVLSLLAANYFVHPNLAEIPWQRFVLSGLMAYLAGLYFRRAARAPDTGEEIYGDICEGLYHFGVTVAIWCAVLLVPSFRHPAIALCALGAPILYFYVRAEVGVSTGLSAARLYRNSAAALSFVVLACYVLRVGFQMVLFPDEPVIRTDYYHYNAPFIMLLSVVMLRLHGLGGTSWLALYGGLALVTGTYFSVTWLPTLSPFQHPVRGAWAAVILGHFWTVVSHQRSPLRTGIQRLAAIDGQHWFDLRRSLGVCLLVATQAAVLFALMDWKANTFAVAPLLVGAASILIHLGVIRASSTYFALAGLQILVALHADFLVDSYLPKDDVIWAIIGTWAAALLLHQFLSRRVEFPDIGVAAAGVTALAMLHVFYHHPCSLTGLWVVATGGVLAAVTPRLTRAAKSGEQIGAAGLLLCLPAWLAYCSQSEVMTGGWHAALDAWPLLFLTAVVFLTGSLSAVFRLRLYDNYDQLDRSSPRLFDQTLSFMGSHGSHINTGTLGLSFALTVIVQLAHYGKAFDIHELALIMGLYAASAVNWFFEGRLRRSMLPYIFLQLSVLGFFAVARRQLMLTTDFWTPEYDVWASLIVSFGLTGCKQIFPLEQRAVRIPLMGTLFTLPIVALVWVLYNHLGTNVALLVVVLHSLMFSFMGKDDKQSPYNLVAMSGFVSFVLMLFWNKLELRVLHAYTLPVGIGVLILLQMFRDRIAPDTRNRIRLVTLVTMIGSAGYYALIDDRYPLAFNMTLILACLAAMGLGSLFRIRLYVLLGFVGLMVDVASILFKVLRGMERSSRMTIVGGCVLLVGVGLVFGAVYYKTNRDRINERLNRVRDKIGSWE